ncbi:MAG: threonine aldolase family protein [Halobacteriota archaeon]
MYDLRSDTVTRPSDEMREAARNAPVGDDVYRDDPTVEKLETAAATRLGKDAALFVPSGTMGNQIAVRTHTDRGQEIVVDEQAHVYKWEVGGLAQLSQLQVRTVDCGDRAVPTPAQVRERYVSEDLHRPGTGLLALENTHNSRGGSAVPVAHVDAAAAAAHELGVPVHLDGARLFNACVALDADPARMVERVDSVMVCVSKGLGAPVGSLLVGDEGFIDRARRERKLLGGGMRQAGLIAAPALLALDNVERLAVDHENARRLAAGLDDLPGLSASTPDTNVVPVDSTDAGLTAEEFVAACERRGVGAVPFGEHVARFCTHLDVAREDIDVVLDRVAAAVEDA